MIISDELGKLKTRWEEVCPQKLSEIDTQILLIEPVLEIAEWNLLEHAQAKRASRNPRAQEFDIETYASPDLLTFAIECKALNNHWFNIDKLQSKGVGRLEQDSEGKWFHDYRKCDGVGQLRAYCMNYKHFCKERSVAILTDGYDWVIFNTQVFTSQLTSSITKAAIVAHANLSDSKFKEIIIDKLWLPRQQQAKIAVSCPQGPDT